MSADQTKILSEPWQQLVTPPEAPYPREPAANPPLNPRSSCLMAEDTLFTSFDKLLILRVVKLPLLFRVAPSSLVPPRHLGK